MVLVDSLLREDLIELLEQSQTRGLNSEDIHDLVNVVRCATGVVHTWNHRKLLQIRTLDIQHLERLRNLASHTPIAHKLILDFTELQATHTGISRDHHLQKTLLDATTNRFNADLVGSQELEANRQFALGVDERTRDFDLLSKLGGQLLRLETSLNLRHIKHTATNELRGIQLHANNPRTANTVRLHREPLLILQNLTILLQNRLPGSHGILVDPHRLRNFTERCLLDFTHLVNRSFLGMLDVCLQLERIARTLGILRCIQQLFNTRNTCRRIRLGRTRRVECVERKLRRGLTNGLRRKSTHHFTRMNLRLNVAEADITQELRKEHLGQTVNHNRLLGSQMEAEQCVEQAVARELILELCKLRDDLCRREIRLGGLRIAVLLKETRHMHGSHDHVIALLAMEHTTHNHIAILEDFVQEIGCLRHGLRELRIDIVGSQRELLVELLQRHRDRGIRLLFTGGRLNSVLTLGNLHDRPAHRTNRAILCNVEILHRLDQTTLNVA